MPSTRFQAAIAGMLGVGTAVSFIENAEGPVPLSVVIFAVAMGMVVAAVLFALFRASLRRRKR
jgi:phosphate/sulfate permease